MMREQRYVLPPQKSIMTVACEASEPRIYCDRDRIDNRHSLRRTPKPVG